MSALGVDHFRDVDLDHFQTVRNTASPFPLDGQWSSERVFSGVVSCWEAARASSPNLTTSQVVTLCDCIGEATRTLGVSETDFLGDPDNAQQRLTAGFTRELGEACERKAGLPQ